MGHWQITSGCKVYQPLRLISWSESQSIQIYRNPPGPLNLDLSVPVFARSVYTVLPKQLVEKTQFWNPWAASPNALCALLAFAHGPKPLPRRKGKVSRVWYLEPKRCQPAEIPPALGEKHCCNMVQPTAF